ncbi:TPA: hypothetical protein L9A62_003390 [Klebsiella pneumoniae]|nr:hypothetical protein [Klebsiella pneumoniae]HBQ8515593.1 hypothetical protein [Klebsiella pneumoniae]
MTFRWPGQRFYYWQAVALGQRLFIFWHTRGRKLAACIFDFYYTTLFFAAGEKRNVATTGCGSSCNWLV